VDWGVSGQGRRLCRPARLFTQASEGLSSSRAIGRHSCKSSVRLSFPPASQSDSLGSNNCRVPSPPCKGQALGDQSSRILLVREFALNRHSGWSVSRAKFTKMNHYPHDYPHAEPDSQSAPHASSVRRRVGLDRSSILLPPGLQPVRRSQPLPTRNAPFAGGNGHPDEPTYDCLSVLQFLSENPSVPDLGLCVRSAFPVSGRGRTYEVRRYSEGSKEQVDVFNYWRPSKAHKYLVLSPTPASGGGEAALVSSSAFRSLLNELRILTHAPLARHPNLLRITSICWALSEFDDHRAIPVICTEYSAFGTLQTFVRAWDCPYSVKRRLVLDVATGLAALHACSIVHGDVKAENVLMFPSQDPDCPFVAKVSDFGFALDTSTRESGDYGCLVGYTPLWAAPEAEQPMVYSKMHSTDIYSLGFVIWTVAMNGQSLFDALDELPAEPALRYAGFRFLKDIDDMDAAAARHILTTTNNPYGSDLNVPELMELSRMTLRLRPEERDLGSLVAVLQAGNQWKLTDSPNRPVISPSKLPPYDPDRVCSASPCSLVSH